MNIFRLPGVNLNRVNRPGYYNNLGLNQTNIPPTRKLTKNYPENRSQKKSFEKEVQKNLSENKSKNGILLSASNNDRRKINSHKSPSVRTTRSSGSNSFYSAMSSLREGKELTKSGWNKLSKSENVTDTINKYYLDEDWENEINWKYLSQNSHAGELLKDNIERIDWDKFIYNKNVKQILSTYPDIVKPFVKAGDSLSTDKTGVFTGRVNGTKPAYIEYLIYKNEEIKKHNESRFPNWPKNKK